MKTFKILQLACLVLLLTDITTFDPRLRKWKLGVEGGCPDKKGDDKSKSKSTCPAQKDAKKEEKSDKSDKSCPAAAKSKDNKKDEKKKCSSDRNLKLEKNQQTFFKAEVLPHAIPKIVPQQAAVSKSCPSRICPDGKCKCKH